MSKYQDGENAWERMLKDARQHRHEQRAEFAKLLIDPCSEVPIVGSRVVVATGLIGRGFTWIRRECVVTEVGSTSYKVRYDGRYEHDRWEGWIHQALVVEVLPAKKAGDK